jgi:PLP dependent protein
MPWIRGIDDVKLSSGGAGTAGDEEKRMKDPGTLRDNHARVLARIAAAARSAGRDPADVTLLAVSKTFPAASVLELAACGQRSFGENYLQEAIEKIEACGRLEWHFIGPIQSNKTRPIAEHFDWVHSVDRDKVARRLSEQRPETLPPLQVCVQVNVSGESSKSGCEPEAAADLAHAVAALPGLRLRGLMAIPEPTDDPRIQRERFGRLRRLLESIRSSGLSVDTLSMGMSDDLEMAIAEGSTIVRVGTALFGRRTGSPVVRPST